MNPQSLLHLYSVIYFRSIGTHFVWIHTNVLFQSTSIIGCIDLKYYGYKKIKSGEKPFSFSLLGATVEYPDFHFSAFDGASEAMWEKHLSAQASAPVTSLYLRASPSRENSGSSRPINTATLAISKWRCDVALMHQTLFLKEIFQTFNLPLVLLSSRRCMDFIWRLG